MKGQPDKKYEKAGDYSDEELKRYRETFTVDLRQIQESEHRSANYILIFLLVGIAAIACSYLISQTSAKWLFGAGFLLVAAGIILTVVIAFLFQRKLKCPACHNSFFGEIEKFCPECGSTSLEPRNQLGLRHCNSCGKYLLGGKNPNFTYKSCTHCGVFLNEEGL